MDIGSYPVFVLWLTIEVNNPLILLYGVIEFPYDNNRKRLSAESSGCSCGFVHCAVNSQLIVSTCGASSCALIDPGQGGFLWIFFINTCHLDGMTGTVMPDL